ncbi:hypothetical protein RQP46_005854 [Phenoliferia psychrophenolica]
MPVLSQFASRQFWLGDYNYAALINPFRKDAEIPFFAPDENLPVALALLLGLQHALAMVGGIISPPILLGGSSGAALSASDQQYLISACLIVCAMGTCLQVSRIRIGKGFYLGTGVLNVTGTSFAFVSVGLTYINNEFKTDGTGLCQLASDGSKLPCPKVYGALLGTASVVSVLAIAMAFLPPRRLKKMFPPLITGSLLLLIGITLVTSGINNWAGGAGSCKTDLTMLCPSNAAPHGEYWGSAPLIGLGFSVFISIILLDLLGPPLVKNCSVFLGLLIGIIISAGCGYFDGSTIRDAPSGTFIWTTTFPLSVRGDLVLPFIAAYFVIISETIGNISGYACALFLFLMGVISKFGAIFVAMPASVLGGMTVFLFGSVAVAGVRILAYVTWSRRARFIATASLSLGFAAVVVPGWFSNFFTYAGPNESLSGFLNAITLIVEESYLICMIIAIPLNLLIPYGSDDILDNDVALLPTTFGPSPTGGEASTPPASLKKEA